MQVTLDISDKFASAINGLSEAIRALAAGAQVTDVSTVQVAPAVDEAESTGPIYWADNSTGFSGKVDDEAAFKAQKKKAPGTYKIPESVYQEKQAELKAQNDAAAKAKKEAAAKAKAEAAEQKPTPKPAAAEEAPSLEDLIAVFSEYLPKDLDKDERAERHAFVKPMLERFGVTKASQIAPEHRALAINIVQRKMAGEDIDPAKADFHLAGDDDNLV